MTWCAGGVKGGGRESKEFREFKEFRIGQALTSLSSLISLISLSLFFVFSKKNTIFVRFVRVYASRMCAT